MHMIVFLHCFAMFDILTVGIVLTCHIDTLSTYLVSVSKKMSTASKYTFTL